MTMNLIEPAIPGQKMTSVWQKSSRFSKCIFCQLPLRHSGDVLLCACCLLDPTQTRIAIKAQLDGWLAQQTKVLEAWETIRDAHPAHWAKLDGRPAGSDDRARAAHPTYALLLDAEAAHHAALTPLAAERARLERALELIDSL